jgi:hypothetical protein
MTNYIPHYTKKLKLFHKRRDRLRRLIHQEAEKERVLKAAEEVRRAKISALKAQFANPPRFRSQDECRKWAAKIHAKISAVETMTTEAVLDEFG